MLLHNPDRVRIYKISGLILMILGFEGGTRRRAYRDGKDGIRSKAQNGNMD